MGGKRKNSGSFSKGDDPGAKKSDDGDSQEELDGLDGNALKWNATNNGVRYSARVMEKQEKLRRESSPAKQIVSDPNYQNTSPSNASPTSLTKFGTKTPGLEDGTSGHDHSHPQFASTSGIHSTHSTSLPGAGVCEEKQRKKRNWELWSQNDKQLFFEALNDFGKDFDAIKNHLAYKQRPKNKLGHCSSSTSAPTSHFIPKNKDQVRHFYYRTWNKISKFLTFPKDMKKAFQELYGLVNYGELRKKQRVLNMKTAAKLSELVEKGTTTIKVRGKTFRIKTPVCRALKRLNRLDDVEQTRLPYKVWLELNARDGKTWAAVQGVSHNPRVKVQVPLQRTLSSVISYFEERWKSTTNRLKDQLLQTFGRRAVPRLRFIPMEKDNMNLPIFRISEGTSSAKLSLRAFTEKMLKEGDKTDFFAKSKKKQHATTIANPEEYITETDMSDFEPGDVGPTCTQAPGAHSKKFNKSVVIEPAESISPLNKALLSPDRLKCASDGHFTAEVKCAVPSTSKESPVASEMCSCPPSSTKVEEDFLTRLWDADTLRKGWSVEDLGTATCGELYLQFGQNEKLCFEYYWDNGEDLSVHGESVKLIDRLVEVARVLKKRKTLTRSKIPLSTLCVKCGHKSEVCSNPLRSTPMHTQAQGSQLLHQHQMPITNSEQTIRLLSGEFPVHYQSALEGNLQKTGNFSGEKGSRRITEPQIHGHKEDVNRNVETFRQPKPIIPKEATVLPPKPFLDLPKGNRRIGRPAVKRLAIPRLLPLRPKTQDPGFFANTFSGAVRSGVVASHEPNMLVHQSGDHVKVPEGQQTNLLTNMSQPQSVSTSLELKNTVSEISLSMGSNEFSHLLKLGDCKLSNEPDNFSLSSFMEISIPESSRMVASACLSSEKFLNDAAEQSSYSLGLSNFLDTCSSTPILTGKEESHSTLCTPMKQDDSCINGPGTPSDRGHTFTNDQWLNSANTNDPNDLSLSSILGTLTAQNSSMNLPPPQSDVNFHSEGSLNFLTKFSEFSKLNTTQKQDET